MENKHRSHSSIHNAAASLPPNSYYELGIMMSARTRSVHYEWECECVNKPPTYIYIYIYISPDGNNLTPSFQAEDNEEKIELWQMKNMDGRWKEEEEEEEETDERAEGNETGERWGRVENKNLLFINLSGNKKEQALYMIAWHPAPHMGS